MKRFVLLALAAFAAVSDAALPRPIGFSFAKGAKFAVAGYSGSVPLTGFPVLVRVRANSPEGFSYADLSSSTGADLCFVDMDGTGLPFEIDTWDASGESLVWVRLPSMTNGAEFVMCWGGGTSGKAVCNESPFSGYVGVWHMSEAGGTVADSSGNGFAATPSGTAAATNCVAVTGPVGNGRQCSTALGAANLSYLSVPSYDSKSVGDTFAVSGWVSIGSEQAGNDNDARLFSRKENYQNAHGWEVLWKTGKEIRVRGAASGDNIKVTGRDYGGKGWKHVFIVYDGKDSVFYEDGDRKGSKTGGTAASENGRPLAIGGYANDNGSQLLGSVDECRLLDDVPSADWAKAEYDSMADTSFLTAGAAESYEELVDLAAGVSVSSVAYTNATVVASVQALGAGAASADVLVQLAAADDFASPLWSTNYSVSAAGVQSFPVAGLATNATYWVRAFVTNSLGAAVASGPVSFTTLAPGAPAGTAAFRERGTTSLSATATLAVIGAGSASATVRLEAAANEWFEGGVYRTADAAAAPGVAQTLVLSNLESGSVYWLRVRFANEWGLETVVPLGVAYTRGEDGGEDGIWVDSLGSGNGTSPESALPTIRAALALAGAGETIWVRGGPDRLYEIASPADAIPLSAEKEGIVIRSWGGEGPAEISISADYALNAGGAPVVSNLAAHATLRGLRFSFTKDSLGVRGASNCNLVRNAAPFLTLSGCEFRLVGDLPDGSNSRSLSAYLLDETTFEAADLLVEGCSFFDCRQSSRGADLTLFRVRDNARFVGNVFSNVTTLLTGIQLANNRCTGPFSFVSNVVFQAGGPNRGLFHGGFAGPRGPAEVAFNRFVNDDGAPWGWIFGKGRETLQNGLVFHHNTVVGYEAFVYGEGLQYNASFMNGEIFDNVFLLDPGRTNIVENASGRINGDGNPKPTMFKAGSFYRNNALRTGAFNGGTAAEVQGYDWSYDITAGLEIDTVFALDAATAQAVTNAFASVGKDVPANAVVPVPTPEFADTGNLFSPNFYRIKASRRDGVFNYGRSGWTGENGEWPEWLGALPPLYPEATMLILR
ncbi:MAG: hypothetical protein II839_12235 [Kiritimatiellae bacterium]|nr:hypothetical protein [Kiritimatiellia bacterium]